MRLNDIFFKQQILDDENKSEVKSEINDFVMKSLEPFTNLDKEDCERAENFIGHALDSFEMEGMREDFMPFFLDQIKELPQAAEELISAWNVKDFKKINEIISNHGYMMRFHPNWDESKAYDFYCFVAIVSCLTIEDELESHKEIIKNWEQLKTTIRSNDYDGADLNTEIYRNVLDDLIFAYGEMHEEPKQTSIEVIRSHYIPIKNKINDYPNILTYMRITSYVIDLISHLREQYKKEYDQTDSQE